MADMDAQIMRILHMGRAPQFPQQLLMGQHPARIGGQHLQDAVFLARQPHLGAVDRHAPLAQIDGQRAVGEDRLATDRTAALA